MDSKKTIDDLIEYQEKWISELNDTLERLRNYKNGTLPYNEDQIDNVANAQSQLALAVKNIADTIRSRLDKNHTKADN